MEKYNPICFDISIYSLAMKKIKFLHLLCLLAFSKTPAVLAQQIEWQLCQQVIGSNGQQAKFQGLEFTYTVGQTLFATLSSPVAILTQGFQQPEYCSTVSGIDKPPDDWQVRCYPNPTSGQLNLTFDDRPSVPVMAQIFDFLGRPVFPLRHVSDWETNFDCSQLPSGCYLLLLRREKSKSAIRLPFIKTER